MERSARAKTTAYVKYLIPAVIIMIIAVVAFLSLRSRPEKELERAVTEEAVRHIESLKKEAEEPIDIEKADHFVDAETLLSKKDRKILITTPKELLEDQSLGTESPIKILVEREKTVITTPRQLLKDKTIGPKTPIRVLKHEEKVIVTTPRELLETQSITPDTPIRVLMEEEKAVVTSPGELLESESVTLDTPIKIAVKEGKPTVTTPRELLENKSITSDTSITVLEEEEKVIVTTPRKLLESESVTLDTPIRIVVKEQRKVVLTTPEELLEDQSITLDTPIKIVLKEEEILTTTPGQLLADKSIDFETPIKLVVEEPEEMITVSELLASVEGQEPSGKTFYIHTVTREDVQGIWGIIQHGLTEQFRKGILLAERMDSTGEPLVTIDLPRQADEPLEDGHSSFLGTLLDKKTEDSYVYNYGNGRMGKNPDYIMPGQELVVTEFSQEELVEIYKHFTREQ